MTPFKIAITGAGPAGCTLATVLARNGCDVTVFEAETSIHARQQGGTLDLRHDGGLAAIKKAGLYNEFRKFARYDGEALIVADKNLKVWIKATGQGTETRMSRPEIDREQLRQMLCDSLPSGTLHWDRKVSAVYRREETGQFVSFTDGSEAGPFDLVVGADGAFSKVRPAVTDVKPIYTGLCYVAGVIPNAEKACPELFGLVNRGSIFTYSDRKSISVQCLSDGSLHIGFPRVCPEEWLPNAKVKDVTLLRADLRQTYASWAPLLQSAIEGVVDDTFQTRALYMLPIGHQWKHHNGVTLIGDAAHLMGPFAGEGVNLAMRDAVNLAEAICQASNLSELDDAVERCEREMFIYMTEKQQLTWENTQDMLFEPDAPRARIQEWVGRMAASTMPPLLRPLVRWGSRIAFFLLKLFY